MRIRGWEREAVALGALGALAAAFLAPVLLGDKLLLPLDTLLAMNPWRAYARERFPDFQGPHNPLLDPVQQYYPWRDFATEWLRRGIFPLWNPYQFGGTPFLANGLSAVLYPPNVLFLWLGPARGFGWSAWGHLWLMGAGMFLLLRGWGLGRLASGLGGAALMLSGYVVAWLEFPNVAYWVATWLPWALWAVQQGWRREGRRAWGFWMATVVFLTLQFLGGHMQVSAHLVLAFLAFVALGRGRVGDLLRWGVGPLLLAGLLAAPHVLPALEMASLGHRREGVPYAQAVANALPWWQLPAFLVPNLFGNPTYRNLYIGHFNYIEMCGYAGVVVLVLASLGAGRAWRRREVLWLTGLTLVALLLALGTPLYALLYYGVPGFRQLSAPGRFLWLVDFGLAGLAAWGMEVWRGEVPRASWRRRFGGGWVALFLLAVAFGLRKAVAHPLYPLLHAYATRQIGLACLWLGTGLGLVLGGWHRPSWRRGLRWGLAGVAVADLFLFGYSFNPKTPREWLYFSTPPLEFLLQEARRQVEPLRFLSAGVPGSPRAFLEWMPPNTNIVYRLAQLQGSDSLVLRSYWRLFGPPSPTLWFERLGNGTSLWLSLLHVRYLMVPMEVRVYGWRPVFAHRGLWIYENEETYPFAWFVPRARRRSAEEVWQRAWREEWSPSEEVWLLAKAGGKGDEAAGEGESPGRHPMPWPWRVEEFAPNRVKLRGEAPEDGWLVVGEAFAPGWRAVVEGERREVEAANFFLRAVAVRRGEREATLFYAPAAFRLGGFLAGIGMGILGALGGAMAGGRGRGRAKGSN